MPGLTPGIGPQSVEAVVTTHRQRGGWQCTVRVLLLGKCWTAWFPRGQNCIFWAGLITDLPDNPGHCYRSLCLSCCSLYCRGIWSYKGHYCDRGFALQTSFHLRRKVDRLLEKKPLAQQFPNFSSWCPIFRGSDLSSKITDFFVGVKTPILGSAALASYIGGVIPSDAQK